MTEEIKILSDDEERESISSETLTMLNKEIEQFLNMKISEPKAYNLNSSIYIDTRTLLSMANNRIKEGIVDYQRSIVNSMTGMRDFKRVFKTVEDLNDALDGLHHWRKLKKHIGSNPILASEWNKFMMLVKLTEKKEKKEE